MEGKEMKKVIITLTEQQANNLVIFLQHGEPVPRIDIPAYVEIVNAINSAQKVEDVEQPKSVATEPETK